MIARQVTDFVTVWSGASWTSPVTYRLKQQRRRLEGILIECIHPDSTNITAPTSEAFGNIVKSVVVSISDVAGSRNLVDAAGVALLDEWRLLGGGLPWDTLVSYGDQIVGAYSGRRVIYPVMFRHPQMEEPAGNLTSVPLYELSDDISITITPGTANEVGAGWTPSANTNFRLNIHFLYRDTTGGNYVCSEIRSQQFDSIASSSRVALEIPSNGLLTSLLLQGYSSAAKTTRKAFCDASDHSLSVLYGREVLRKTTQFVGAQFEELTTPGTGTFSTALRSPGISALAGKAGWDFLDDMPLIGAFSPNSAVNLTSIRAGGDTAQVVIDPTAAATLCVRMTTRKFIGGAVGQLLGV